MGRELKRVPLDFDWPLGMIWKGFLNPYASQDCTACGKSGYNPETKKIYDSWYDFENRRGRYDCWCYNLTQEDVQALLDAGRLWDFTRVPRPGQEDLPRWENGWLKESNGYIPTAEEVNAWARQGTGHDGINHWVCAKAKAERLGVYGLCKYCQGKGYIFATPEIEKLHEEWESFEPPEGEGYQLWSTTTEGHPMSPVFKTLNELCEWCADNETTFGSFKATAEEWRKMLDDGHVYHQEGNMIFG